MEEKKTARPRGTDSAEIVQVIKTRAISGTGEHGDPCVMQIRYWTTDGKLIATLEEDQA